MSKYIFTKNSNLERPRNISIQEYSLAEYGSVFEYSPKDIPLRIYHFSGSITGSDEYNFLKCLKNTINYYKAYDELYNYENFVNKPSTLYAFSSYHLGSGFEKGSIELNIYLSGSLLVSANDLREDGILYESGSDSKVGIVLYNEGFIILNNTASLTSSMVDFSSSYQEYTDNPRWIHAFASSSESMYYDINYSTKNEIYTNLNFIFANKSEYNHSNNRTYIKSGSYSYTTSSYHFKEDENIKICKTNSSPFVSGSANFEKQTFISKIGMYDKDKKLIGIASLSNPVRKTDNREFVFKIKLDI